MALTKAFVTLLLVLAVTSCALADPGIQGQGKGGNGNGNGIGGGILGKLTGGNFTGGWGQGGILSGISILFGNGSTPGDLGEIFGRKGGNGKGKGNGKGNGKGRGRMARSLAAVATSNRANVMGTGNGKRQGQGNGQGMGKGKGQSNGWGKRGKSAGGVLAQLRGSSVVDDAMAATGDGNAAGVLEITLLQNGTDYDVAFTARISLSGPGAPTALTLNSGTAATNGSPLLDFSTATAADGASPPAWTTVASPSPGSGPMGRAWGRLQRTLGRSGRTAGLHTFTLTGMWAAAGSTAAADGVQTVKDVALAVVAQPSAFYAVVASPGFDSGAARGQFQKAPKGWAFGLRN
ncbi:hypothetical protein CLOM_g1310 [Closterium sp. NIES-68]|nr:hypothetical protein CLOM_g1310 [Closterium sp. NIES-68]GJP62744.1 hypothetical protein CLOP_g19766 [Closterium sp. NIES-67]